MYYQYYIQKNNIIHNIYQQSRFNIQNIITRVYNMLSIFIERNLLNFMRMPFLILSILQIKAKYIMNKLYNILSVLQIENTIQVTKYIINKIEISRIYHIYIYNFIFIQYIITSILIQYKYKIYSLIFFTYQHNYVTLFTRYKTLRDYLKNKTRSS